VGLLDLMVGGSEKDCDSTIDNRKYSLCREYFKIVSVY